MKSMHVVALIAAIVLAGCGRNEMTVQGELVLNDIETHDSDCEGVGGYDDIHEGAEVVIRDAGDKKVGIGSLSVGKASDSTSCSYAFKVKGVDATDQILSVEVAGRGQVSFKRKDAAYVGVSLGD